MMAAMWDSPAASAFALLGAICFITWPLYHTRRDMLLVQLGVGIGFGLHYALWGGATAAAINGLGAIQTAASLLFGTSPRLRCLGYALIPAIVGASALTWGGIPSLLAAIGQTLMALGRMQIKPSAMRILVLSGVLFWVAHDLVIRSPLVIADLLSLAIGAVALLQQVPPRNALPAAIPPSDTGKFSGKPFGSSPQNMPRQRIGT
jgi:hypothetical protein